MVGGAYRTGKEFPPQQATALPSE